MPTTARHTAGVPLGRRLLNGSALTATTALAATLIAPTLIAPAAHAAPPAPATFCGITGTIWDDLNANGIKDPGEPDGDALATATPTATPGVGLVSSYRREGRYFTEQALKPNTQYTVKITVGFNSDRLSPSKVGTDPTLWSVPDSNGEYTVTTNDRGCVTESATVGVIPFPTTFTGRLFYDVNRNGRYDEGETPRPNQTVTLTHTPPHGEPETATATTDRKGLYSLTVLPSGGTVTLTFPEGSGNRLIAPGADLRTQSAPQQSTASYVHTLSVTSTTVTANAGYTNVELKVFGPGRIGGLAALSAENRARALRPGAGIKAPFDFTDSYLQYSIANLGQTPSAPFAVEFSSDSSPVVPRSEGPDNGLCSANDGVLRCEVNSLPPGGRKFISMEENTHIRVVVHSSESPMGPSSGSSNALETSGAGVTTLEATAPSVRATAFDDVNGNGVRDAGEKSLPDLDLTITPTAPAAPPAAPAAMPGTQRTPVASTAFLTTTTKVRTDPIPLAPETTYTVTAELPTGATFSPTDQGNDDTMDSDVDTRGRYTFTTAPATIVTTDATGTTTTGPATPQITTVDVGVRLTGPLRAANTPYLPQTLLALALLTPLGIGLILHRRQRRTLAAAADAGTPQPPN